MRYRKKEKGQALTEMVIALPILLLLMFGFYQFAQISLAKQKVYMAARYGARLRSTLPATPAQRAQTEGTVREAVQDYLKYLPGPPAEVSVSYYIGYEGVRVSKEIPIMGYLKNAFPAGPYKLTASCYMENDPWEWGTPKGTTR